MMQMDEHERVSLQVVHFQCGVCTDEYEVELLIGDKKMVNCPDCGNTSLQMIVGTE
jgi:Zn finger protein HypA/HybF involved in hydrogenase expression